jgi:hypothetical protein
MENSVIPDNSISATAIAGAGKEAKNARLNGGAAWCGLTIHDYLQIDLGGVRKLHKLATQGHPTLTQWVEKFLFHYSLDNIHWYQYEPTEKVKEVNYNNVVKLGEVLLSVQTYLLGGGRGGNVCTSLLTGEGFEGKYCYLYKPTELEEEGWRELLSSVQTYLLGRG